MSALPDRLEQAAAEGSGLLFLSPHLDDAVLSCGALIAELSGRCPITVVTLFTATGPQPHTHAAKAFLRQCATPDADELYAARQAEDRAVLDGLGVAHLHLGVPDALFRRREVRSGLARRAGERVPELVHRYPTYRFDIARGRVSRGDRGLVDVLDGQVSELVRSMEAALVFAPIGVGRHVDHLITRELGRRQGDRVVHYSDFPYDQSTGADARYLAEKRLTPWRFGAGVAAKHRAIEGYGTQVEALFPGGRIPEAPETYFLPG